MYKFKYDTVRSRHDIPEKEKSKLVDIFPDRRDIRKVLSSLTGEKIVTLTNASFSKETDELEYGVFRFGTLKNIEFYKEGRNYNANIWFTHGGYATGLNEVQDIMLMDSLEITGGIPAFEDLRVFHFSASAASEREDADVIHVDPFLAYINLMGTHKTRNGIQDCQIKKLEVGYYNYKHEDYGD